MAEVPSTRKVQITVPVADTSVIEWLDLQYSASESVRRLIRESIAREGFVDVANRPVRPPADPAYVAEVFPADSADVAEAPADIDETTASVPAPAPEPAAEKNPSSPQTGRSRSAGSTAASATIDDLLGL